MTYPQGNPPAVLKLHVPADTEDKLEEWHCYDGVQRRRYTTECKRGEVCGSSNECPCQGCTDIRVTTCYISCEVEFCLRGCVIGLDIVPLLFYILCEKYEDRNGFRVLYRAIFPACFDEMFFVLIVLVIVEILN